MFHLYSISKKYSPKSLHCAHYSTEKCDDTSLEAEPTASERHPEYETRRKRGLGRQQSATPNKRQCRMGNGDGESSGLQNEEDVTESDCGASGSGEATDESDNSSNEDNGVGDSHTIAREAPRGDALGPRDVVFVAFVGFTMLLGDYTEQYPSISIACLAECIKLELNKLCS